MQNGYTFLAAGFGQGIRRSIFSLAAIMGPLWAGGSAVNSENEALFSNYYVLFGVPCGLLLLVLVSIYKCQLHAG